MKEIELFIENVNRDISEASILVEELGEYMWYHQDKKDLFLDEKKEFNEILLQDYIENGILKIFFILEYLKLNELLEKFKGDISKFEGKYIDFYHIPYIGIFSNPLVDTLAKYVKAIGTIIPSQKLEKNKIDENLVLLRRILKGTPKIIADRGIEPQKESDVQREVYNTLIHIFPDTLREIPIPKEVTTYKPDIGVRSLECAIEYKFVDNEKEAKKFLGGIYEDMFAYEGTKDWTKFYAIIYMTDNFFTQEQINSQLSVSKVKKNWEVILVYGRGQREKRNKRR